MRRALVTIGAASLPLVTLPLGACGRGGSGLVVGAAASLQEALTAAVERGDLPDAELSFAGSQTIVTQAAEGAPFDVVVTADAQTMARLEAAGGVEDRPVAVARNRLALVVPVGNPARIDGIGDLDRPGVRVVLASPDVPAGRLAAGVLATAGIDVDPISLEASVSGVVTKVRLGEADAGIAYVTDLESLDGDAPVDGVPLEGNGAVATYYAAIVAGTDDAGEAREFVEELTSAPVQAALARDGFEPVAAPA